MIKFIFSEKLIAQVHDHWWVLIMNHFTKNSIVPVPRNGWVFIILATIRVSHLMLENPLLFPIELHFNQQKWKQNIRNSCFNHQKDYKHTSCS